ncbi:hypothetical protein GCM10027280_53320 [Micromonospora polyrhachis]|uniref:DUF6457 domain-containing protein n=1 Tax=Micromonospora polyrhachis TaxID=1282883 RepID=A0A7W7SWL4_9ACTN|nr:DUF6457 domain-containing protein [Micromonospora polyrhachis]MBB4961901.1 hypothetical protein [Micromonospora polyrhachis]
MDTQAPLWEWLVAAATALDTPELSEHDIATLLDLVREVAHGVCRPAGPLAAYLIGVAVGRGADPRVAAAIIGGLVTEEQSVAAPTAASVTTLRSSTSRLVPPPAA